MDSRDSLREACVPGYFMTDPDGHQWFAVSTRYAGTFGENLQFIHEPDELNHAS